MTKMVKSSRSRDKLMKVLNKYLERYLRGSVFAPFPFKIVTSKESMY